MILKKSLTSVRFMIITAFLIRLLFLKQHAVWFDEQASLFVSRQPINKLFSVTAQDTHPPLYFLILKAWMSISSQIYFLRLLSLLAGVATITVNYYVLRQLVGNSTAYQATWLLTLSPLHVYYSTEIRMYALLLFESLIIIFLFLKYVKTGRFLYLPWVLVSEVIALYTHYYAVLIPIAITSYLFIRPIVNRRLVYYWSIIQLMVAILFAPWLLSIVSKTATGCWCFPPQLGIPTLLAAFAVGSVGIVTFKDIIFMAPLWIIIIFIVVSIWVTLLALLGMKRARFPTLLSALFFIPLILITIVSVFFPFFSPRAFIIILPIYYVWVSWGLTFLKQRVATIVLFIFFILILMIQLTQPFFRDVSLPKKNLQLDRLEFMR